MFKFAVVGLVAFTIGDSRVSATCLCKPPLPNYTSELCCEHQPSTAQQFSAQQSTFPEDPWQEDFSAENLEGLWQETLSPEDPWKEEFSPDASERWKSQQTDQNSRPRHGFRHHKLTEHQQEALQRTLLLIQDLQRSPNSSGVRPPRQALPTPVCDPLRRYRTQDGTCNHPERPLQGAAGQGNTRLIMPPAYQDGVFLPHFLDSAGRPLPGARRISLAVTSARDTPLTHLTDSVMQWGQFIDHDLAMTPEVEPDSPCCRDGRRSPAAHPFCLPISARPRDPVYSHCRRTCIEFVRSVPAWHARLRVMTQLNTRTSFIDADMLYGVTDAWVTSLRDDAGGRLRVGPGKLLLPDPEPEERCFSTLQNEPCFRSGDHRVNEQVRLAVMHIVWMREHNRIAARLEELNPHWDDERLFQESRRIVIAEIQHITYSHWLPIVLGNNFTNANMMGSQTPGAGYSNRYNAETEPTIATEFSSAAFRFGHSLINNHVFLFSDLSEPPFGFTRLRDIFFNPHLIYQGALDFLAKSLVAQAPQKCDLAFARALTGHLFQERGSQCGLDLVALNIQRGRDHGIPSYTAARRWCGLPRTPSFAALTRVISPEAVIRLAGVYRSVDDIDLYIGGVAERPTEGALVGPTLQCLIGNQFFRLRWGDNFFYDLGGDKRRWRFSLAQLTELRRASWARVLCDAIPTITAIQPDAFRATREENKLTGCQYLPEINLDLWREESE